MARRKFELPGIQDLSKEQEAARALPRRGRHLIVGGPGTGKSVLALIRARRHHREKDEYRFLVFNHLLHRAGLQLFGDRLASETWQRWFRCTFERIAKRPVPLLPPNRNGFEAEDWDRIEETIQALPPDDEDVQRPFLVIDEGQDMPPAFYESLVGLGFEDFFVVADQNQQITEQNSSRQEIETRLDLDTDAVIELRRNFRNQYRVAKLARAFYTGDPASPPPDLPVREAGHVPQLYEYRPENLDRICRAILTLADRDPRQLIGVIAPNNDVREKYFKALRSVEAALDHPRPAIETFYGSRRPDIAFDEGGILVINAQACKGLEFDSVCLADVDEHRVDPRDPDRARRRFYVMVARARERVFLFMKRGAGAAVEALLPRDSETLQRGEW